MNNNRNNNRRRGRGNNRQQGGGQQLNRIDSRARGNAPQLLEKYRKLAHDAHLNGDRVNEEYYLQFADHYFRVIADTRQRQEEQRARRDDRWQDGGEGYADDGDFNVDADDGSPYADHRQPEPRREREERSRYQDRPRYDEPANADANSDANSDEDGPETGSEPIAGPAPVYEPAENPFTRETRPARGLRPRREDRRPRRDDNDAPASLDASVLPPAISAGRDEAAATPVADAAEPAEKPKVRRTRRPKPPTDEAGEELSAAS